jgi:hypothetical protein
MTLAWDRIHPNATGHTILARAFLSAIGACPTVDARALAGQSIERRRELAAVAALVGDEGSNNALCAVIFLSLCAHLLRYHLRIAAKERDTTAVEHFMPELLTLTSCLRKGVKKQFL